MKPRWTDLSPEQRVEIIKQVYTPDKSAAMIADEISQELGSTVSRNAIVGYYSRNPELRTSHPLTGNGRLSGSTKKPPMSKRTKPIVIPPDPPRPGKPVETVSVTEEDAATYDSARPGVRLLDLEYQHCRWPVSRSDGEHLFCGAKRRPGKPYCDHHLGRNVSREP